MTRDKLQKTVVLLHKNGPRATLEEMPHLIMPPIETVRTDRIQIVQSSEG